MATAEQWQQVQDLFYATLEKEPQDRMVFLDQACGGDQSLRREVAWLISAHETEDHFIDSPAYVAARDVLADHHFEPGEMLAHYKIQAALGSGGMGEVYLAEDTRLNRKVALKILPPHFTVNPDRVRRFEREARAASALNHPNIVTIYEIGQSNTPHFIATEFVDGKTLRQLINENPFTLNETLNVSMQVADALSGAHVAGIVHRDIKPENIMIREDGYVKILDFGLAKLTEQQTTDGDLETPTLLQSNPGLVMGTVHYMSPEQARARNVGTATDIWSLGIVMYELLAGHVPFSGETPSHVMVSLMEDKLPPLKDQAKVPEELDRFVTKALRKNQKERYQTAGQLARELKNLKQTLQRDSRLHEWLKAVPSRKEGPQQMWPVTPLGNQKSGTPYLETLKRRGFPSVRRQTNPAVTDLPESRRDWSLRRLSFAAIGVIALVAALALGYRYFFNSRSINSRSIDSIAVMPFVNESGNAELEYLSDGMTETLIASLSKLPDLQVKASSSVFRYKGSTDTQTIGKELNARAVLYGRVVQRGEDLVLHVELVDAQTENSLWGQTYNKKLSNLIALQGEVARDLVRELSLKPSGADKQKLGKNYTENVEAYQLFLNGRFHHRKLTPPEIKKGIAYLQQAIDTDPSYALAYTEISRAYLALALAGDMNPGEVLLKAKAAAQRAVEIDDALAEAHSSLGSVFFWYDWNWKEAEEHFIRALELDPNSSIAHFGYADFLSKMERPEEALAEIKRAREIEPFSPFINTFEAWFLAAGQPDAAMERVGIAIDLDPNFFFAHWIAAEIYKGKKMYPESIAESRLAKSLSPHQTWSDVGLAYTFVETGQLNESRAILNEMLRLSESRWVPPYHIALVYNALGETDQALAWLEKGYQHRDPKMALLKEERWKNLRGDPRFQDILRRVGLVGAK